MAKFIKINFAKHTSFPTIINVDNIAYIDGVNCSEGQVRVVLNLKNKIGDSIVHYAQLEKDGNGMEHIWEKLNN